MNDSNYSAALLLHFDQKMKAANNNRDNSVCKSLFIRVTWENNTSFLIPCLLCDWFSGRELLAFLGNGFRVLKSCRRQTDEWSNLLLDILKHCLLVVSVFSPLLYKELFLKEKHKAKVKDAMKHCKMSFYSSILTSEMFRVFSFLRNILMCWNRDYVQEQWYDPDMQSSYVIQKHLYIQYALHRRRISCLLLLNQYFFLQTEHFLNMNEDQSWQVRLFQSFAKMEFDCERGQKITREWLSSKQHTVILLTINSVNVHTQYELSHNAISLS